MGSYAYLNLGGYPLASTKNDVDPTAMMLFTKVDKRIRLPDPAEVPFDPVDGEEVDYSPTVEYVASLAVVRDRLEFMGYTLDKSREEFRQGVAEQISEKQKVRDHILANATNHDGYEHWREHHDDEIRILSSLTFDGYLDALRFIITNNCRPGHGEKHELAFPPVVWYLLNESPYEGVWTPLYDFRSWVRAAIEVTGVEPELIYDISDVVSAGYIDQDVDLCEWARRQTAEEFVQNYKVIVLTEGKSDKWCIEGALHILYPHLTDYYSFMDFELARVEGVTGALVSAIKAFIGAGIVNRTIALFDNDSAARAALHGLRDVKIPPNVRIVHLPEVEWAKTYPTQGPQGLMNMDVNGLAGSIELYLGLDVLRQEDGTLMPVQWRGFEVALNAYQGEVMNKLQLQEKYQGKLAECRRYPDAIVGYDWTGMRAIIDVIRSAFNDTANTRS
jgi:hypothetical protein